MSKKQVAFRVAVLSLVMCLISGIMGLRMVWLQLLNGESYRATASRRTSVQYTVKASRGEILDRDGAPLVSNELSYSVRFDYYDWDRENQNEVILETCRILDQGGVAAGADVRNNRIDGGLHVGLGADVTVQNFLGAYLIKVIQTDHFARASFILFSSSVSWAYLNL